MLEMEQLQPDACQVLPGMDAGSFDMDAVTDMGSEELAARRGMPALGSCLSACLHSKVL